MEHHTSSRFAMPTAFLTFLCNSLARAQLRTLQAGKKQILFTLVRDYLVVFGGFSRDQSNSAYTFHLSNTHLGITKSIATGKWSLISHFTGSPPSPRHFHSAVVYQDSIFISGGFSQKQNRNDLWRLKLSIFDSLFKTKLGSGCKSFTVSKQYPGD